MDGKLFWIRKKLYLKSTCFRSCRLCGFCIKTQKIKYRTSNMTATDGMTLMIVVNISSIIIRNAG
jgi:hypothetical protein